jgi:hypothetical protein
MRDSEVYASILFHGLKRCAQFDTLASSDFARIYNGYGPDAWPKGCIKTLTWIFGMFPEVAGVHDVDYYFSDGKRKGFELTVKRWKKNCSIMLNVRYPLSSPSLYIHRSIAWTKLLLARQAIAGSSAYQFYLKAHQNLIAKRGYKV